MLFYRACLPLSRRTLNLTARTIRNHRRAARSRWRRLDAAQQALLVLVHLRKGETFAEVGAGFGVGATTAWRYVRETTRLLADQAPSLEQGLRRVRSNGWDYVILDGTLIAGDRLAADRPFYSGKHRHHGMNAQVVATPDGDPVWVSGALPGAVHD
ncbi:transposase family protein, partial [Streptomonospora algeriensis]